MSWSHILKFDETFLFWHLSGMGLACLFGIISGDFSYAWIVINKANHTSQTLVS